MDAAEFNSWQKGKYLYLLLWITAGFIIAGIVFAGTTAANDGKNIFINQDFESPEATNETINELLLSADELSITEKKSFINLYLRPGENSITIVSADSGREKENVYKQIFKRKVSSLRSKEVPSDFSIKPIPK